MAGQNRLQSNDNNAAHDMPVMNKGELTSIRALLAYTAHNQNVSEAYVVETVTKRFGVNDVEQLSSHTYDDVIRFLVDVQVSMLLN